MHTITANFKTLKKVNSLPFLDDLIQLINQYKDEFVIEGFTSDTSDNRKFRPLNSHNLSLALNRSPILTIGGNNQNIFEMFISQGDGTFLVDRYITSSITIDIASSYFFENNQLSIRKKQILLDYCMQLYCITEPLCGYIHDRLDASAIGVALGKHGVTNFFGIHSISIGHIKLPHAKCPISGIYWGNYFGPDCVEFYGKHILSSLKGIYNYKELRDGGVLFFTSDNPLTPDKEQTRTNQLEIWKQLKITPLPKIPIIKKYKKTILKQKTHYLERLLQFFKDSDQGIGGR